MRQNARRQSQQPSLLSRKHCVQMGNELGGSHTSSSVHPQNTAQEPGGNTPGHLFILPSTWQRHIIIPK